MLAGSNNLGLLLIGALVVVGGLLLGYILSKPKTAATKEPAELHGEPIPTEIIHDASHTDDAPPNDAPVTEAPATMTTQNETPRDESETSESSILPDNPEDDQIVDLDEAMQGLDTQIKHRIIYRFMPHLKGMLFEGETLDGYLADATGRALQRGWSHDELITAAQNGKWKRRRAEEPSSQS